MLLLCVFLLTPSLVVFSCRPPDRGVWCQTGPPPAACSSGRSGGCCCAGAAPGRPAGSAASPRGAGRSGRRSPALSPSPPAPAASSWGQERTETLKTHTHIAEHNVYMKELQAVIVQVICPMTSSQMHLTALEGMFQNLFKSLGWRKCSWLCTILSVHFMQHLKWSCQAVNVDL